MNNDSLFALKVYYEDLYENEYDIIRMLKCELLDQGMEENEVNIKLKNFYDSFNSNIDLQVFENINVPNNILLNYVINNNVTENFINYLVNNSMLINNNMEDVLVTLNQKDLNKLNKYILTKKLDNNKCMICFDCIDIDQEVIELTCHHIYHSNCIIEYLTKYNYKCPYCKKELGEPVYNI
jgi:hypothetical protein